MSLTHHLTLLTRPASAVSGFLSLGKAALLMLTVAGLSGCSSIPVSQDYQSVSVLKEYATYQWLPSAMQTAPTADSVQKNHPFIAQRLEKSIQNNLHNRKALFVRQAPEAYITYRYTTSKVQTVTPSSSFGFGWHTRSVGLGTQFPIDYTTETYEEAKWGIDIHDTTGALIWRGESTQSVQGTTTPAEAERNTQAIVDAILSQYPPKK